MTHKSLPSGFITQALLKNYCIGILTVIMEKNFFKKKLFDKKYNIIGDFDFFLKLSQKYKINCIQEPLAIYRIHDSNYSKVKIDLFIKELKKWIFTNEKKLNKISYTCFVLKIHLFKLRFKSFFKILGV